MKDTLYIVWVIIVIFMMVCSLIDWSILIYHSDTWNGKWWQHTADLAFFWGVLYVIYKLGKFHGES